jgi:FkbM family methyltransferase
LSTNRPIALRRLPARFRSVLLNRYYRPRRDRWLALYENACLVAAPGVSMKLVPGDLLSDQLAFVGMYEEDLTRRMEELGRQGGTMIDVGANLGYFSLLWASFHPGNRSIAFEAAPRNLEILRTNVSRNGLEQRIRIVPAAATRQQGRLSFDLGPDDQRGWGGITLEKNSRQIEVDAVRVDQIVDANEPIALLKVDVEGADTWALMGCERLLKAGLVKEVWFEQNKPRMAMLGIRENAAQDYLEATGYACAALNNRGDALVEWRAIPRARR